MSAQVKFRLSVQDWFTCMSAPPWELSDHGITICGTTSGMRSAEPLQNVYAFRPGRQPGAAQLPRHHRLWHRGCKQCMGNLS